MPTSVQVNVVLPGVTAALGFAFVGVLVGAYARRPRAHLLAWTLGILWYAIAAATEALGGALGWTPGLYRAWYITGALGVAAYLGAGTVYLHREPGFRSLTVVCLLLSSAPALATGHLGIGFTALGAAVLATLVLSVRPTWFADVIFATLLLTTFVAATLVLAAPLDLAGLPRTADQVVSGQALDSDIRALTPPLNLSGAVLLLFGAVGSAIAYARSRAEPRRVAANVLIAAGAFVPSVASGLTRFGVTSIFFVGELLGLVCILAGFVLSRGSAIR